MIFRIKTDLPFNVIRNKLYLQARRVILLYKYGINEQQLNKYLIKKYNKNLTNICLLLVNNATISFDFNGNILVTFIDKKLDNLATLINCGNGIIQGSNILNTAFCRN